jgi:hypothetical protein
MKPAPLLAAESIEQLRMQLQKLPLPHDPVQSAEFATLLSLSYSPLFYELFVDAGVVAIGRGDDPPDFVITSPGGRTSLEITRFTVPQAEIFHRERKGPGLYTSTLRAGKPGKKFWSDLKGGTLPDDSQVEPHVEARADLDADYFKAAGVVLQQKQADLTRYGGAYQRRILLVYDKLSEFKAEFERRLPELRRFVATLPEPRFDAVLLVDGNHYSGVFAAKL